MSDPENSYPYKYERTEGAIVSTIAGITRRCRYCGGVSVAGLRSAQREGSRKGSFDY